MVPASVSANVASAGNIGITVDGRNINFDVAPFVDAQNRTMVPIRFISDEFGARVDWMPTEQRVTIRYQGQEIVLWIGSRDARINGNTVTMDTQAVLVNGRTMVPIRFIGESFWADVDWQPNNRMVVITRGAGVNQTQGDTIIVASDNVNVRSGAGTGYSLVGQVVRGNEFRIMSSANDSEGRVWYQITLNNGRVGWIAGWLVTLSGNNHNQTPPQNESPVLSGDGGQVAIVIGNVVNLRRGPGTSYDILGTTRSGDMLEILNGTNGWHHVRTVCGTQGWISGQHISVQNIRDDRRPQIASRGAGRIVSFNNPSFLYSALMGLEYEEQDEAFFITLTGDRGMSYNIMYLENPYRIVIDIQGVTVDLPQGAENIPLNNAFVNRIRVSQFSENVGRVVLELRSPIVIRELSRQGDSELTFLLQRTSLAGALIVIDPGHGTLRDTGSTDPGAVGLTGLAERDVVMDISNRVADILREKGAEVVLTREGPSTNLTLQCRAQIANSLDADLFVSIHANANTNRDIGGTSTFFYAPADNPRLASQRFQRIRLAQLVQDSLVEHGGRQDIGIIQRPFVVIRDTNMPSILVETAFISNPTEEQLLADPEFRARMARGIAEGIERFFN